MQNVPDHGDMQQPQMRSFKVTRLRHKHADHLFAIY